jgi:hypothetical protein
MVVVIFVMSPASAGVVRPKLVSRYQGIDAIHAESSTFGFPISGNGRFVAFSADDDGLPGTDPTTFGACDGSVSSKVVTGVRDQDHL